MNEIYSDGWLHRGQELAVHKEAYLLSQTGVASRQREKEGDGKSNVNRISPDPQPSSTTSDSSSGNSQQHTDVTSPGFVTEEKLKKFKYEPLQDDADCWGGMLFEQDLYGRMCTRKYVQTRANNHLLSITSKGAAGNKIIPKSSGSTKLTSEMSVEDLLKMPSSAASKPVVTLIDCTAAPVEETLESLWSPSCLNNNISFSLTLGDLNMNNSDFSFIDSDGSSKSEMVDPLNSLGRTSQESNQDSMLTIPEEMFTLKDTYIPETNSSFEITPNKLPNISAFCQDNCHECLCDCQIETFNGNFTVISKDTVALASQNQSPYAECQQGIVDDDLKKTQTVIDDNGNLQAKVVSARLRPKGVTRTDSCRSPVNQSRSGDGEFEQFLSLVKNISHEGPLSYQPSKSALSTIRVLDEQIKEDKQTSPDESPLTENHVMGEVSEISFKDFHAKVAPVSRTPAKSTMLSGGEQSHSITSALSLTSDHQAKLCPPSICAPSSDTSSTGPPHEGPTYTSCTTSNTDQPLVDAHHSLLPEETQPASNLPYQESR